MTLATTCPSCRTSFKVVPDQLKLRRGLVRCGKCEHVFSGIDFLTYVEPTDTRASLQAPPGSLPERSPAVRIPTSEGTTILAAARARAVQATLASAPAMQASPSAPEPSTGAVDPNADQKLTADPMRDRTDALHTAFFIPDTDFGTHALDGHEGGPAAPRQAGTPLPGMPSSGMPSSSPAHSSAPQAPASAPPERLTPSREPRPFTPFAPHEPEAVESITLTSTPAAAELPDSPMTTAEPAPSSVADAPAWTPTVQADDTLAEPARSRWPALAAAAVLATALGAQALVGWRDDIAVRLPALAPLLSQVMSVFGWSVASPRNRDALSIESFELRAGNTAGEFELSALLSNRAAYPVALPALELTLKDSAGGVMLRKVLTAADYSNASQTATSPLPGRSERAVRVQMALNGPAPAGYSADLFYP